MFKLAGGLNVIPILCGDHMEEDVSDKHQLVLEFIRAYIRFHGMSPSYQTIALGLGMKSKANIHRIIHKLQEEGHLTIRPYKFNSIKLTDRSAREMATL